MNICSFCGGTEKKNKNGVPEILLACADCENKGHPTCLQFNDDITRAARSYDWQCIDCKVCVVCKRNEDD
eukprot:Pgem_evm1s1610